MAFLVDGQDVPQGIAELEGASALGVAAGDARGAALRRDQRHFSALGAEIGVQADEYGRGCRLCQAIRGAGVEAGDPRWSPGDPVQVASQDPDDCIRERAHALFPKAGRAGPADAPQLAVDLFQPLAWFHQRGKSQDKGTWQPDHYPGLGHERLRDHLSPSKTVLPNDAT